VIKVTNLWVENLLRSNYLDRNLYIVYSAHRHVTKPSGGRRLEDRGTGTITLECYPKETGFSPLAECCALWRDLVVDVMN
jgi:hypothetical protein